MLLRDAADPRRQDRYWLGADLVAEVVSADDPERDYAEKRSDYAERDYAEKFRSPRARRSVSTLS